MLEKMNLCRWDLCDFVDEFERLMAVNFMAFNGLARRWLLALMAVVLMNLHQWFCVLDGGLI